MDEKILCDKNYGGCGREIDTDTEKPVHFNEEDYWLCRSCFDKNWEEDIQGLKTLGKKLELKWRRRILGDENDAV